MVSDTYCELCNQECQTAENWASHVAGTKHQKRMGSVPVVKEIVIFKDEFDDDDWYELPKSTVPSKTYCATCKLEFNSSNNYSFHMGSRAHQKRVDAAGKQRIFNYPAPSIAKAKNFC